MVYSTVVLNEVKLIEGQDPKPDPRRIRGSICVIGRDDSKQYFIVTRTRNLHTYTDRWQLTALDDGNNWANSRDNLAEVIRQAEDAMSGYGGRWLNEGEVLQTTVKECIS